MDPELIEYLDRRFDEAAKRADQRFEQVDRRFEQVDQRFEQVDQRFERVDQRFERVDQEQRETRILLEDMRATLQTVAEGVLANTEAYRVLRLDLDRQFEEIKTMHRLSYAEIDRRLRDHDRRLDILERR
jgi:ABC-type transporter Mla subunit MlaD